MNWDWIHRRRNGGAGGTLGILFRVCNSKYEPTAMNDFMRSVKHLTQVLIVGAYCVYRSRKFADSDVMKISISGQIVVTNRKL